MLSDGNKASDYSKAGGKTFVNRGAGGSGSGGTGSGSGGGSIGGSYNTGTRLLARTGATDGNSGNRLVIISYISCTSVYTVK
ncbi:hypothetical protein [Spirosoma agri]|uniref:Uncharacterized protein n=1 Tax=Spirosoma agri TaxID=1987381 RepID=A0A6M0IIY2_9BACT|nr:hypothetical protein [Spirosoma agri]NEU66933.1 hypothetical protein [Spirosoma agri]